MYILLALTAGLSLGIFLRSVLGLGVPIALFALLLAALCAVAFFLARRPGYLLCMLLLFATALGVGRTWLAEAPPSAGFAAHLRERVSYGGVVVADPDIRKTSQRITVAVAEGGEHTRVLAVVGRDAPRVVRGDRVAVYGTLRLPEPFASEGGRVFHYDKYLEARGIRFLLSYGSIRVTQRAPWYSVPAALSRAKAAFLQGLSRAMPDPYAALAGGIVIGGKSGLGEELQAAFIRSGLVQVVVLSGYNVMVVAEWTMIVVGAFAALLARRVSFAIPRASGYATAGAALLLFVGIAGFSATAVRAALMALIALYARATGRTYVAGRALLVTVLLMLLSNPLYLAFDPGFGLSVAATAGLIWLAPRIEGRLWRVPALARDALATTLAAQTAVLPLLLYETGTLSVVAVLANVLVMPVVPLLMGTAAFAGAFGALVGGAVPVLAFIGGLPAFLLSAFVIFVARMSAAPLWAALTIPAFPFALVAAAYAVLVAVALAKRSSATDQLRLSKKAFT